MPDSRDRAVDIPGTDGPSISSVPVSPIQAPHVVAPTEGFAILQQGFQNFFGGASQGMQAVAEATQAAQKQELATAYAIKKQDIQGNYHVQRAEAEKQNKAQAEQATADALAGKQPNPAMAQDYNYSQAFEKASGTLHGADLSNQWYQQVYANLKPGDNISSATEQFLKDNYGNGTGNPMYDATALSHFRETTSRLTSQFIDNSVKSVVATGLQNQDAAVAAAVKNGSIGEQLPALMDGYRTLDPMDPSKAPLRIAQALRASAIDGNPQASQSLLAALEKPGTGVNGKSYAESFPAGYKEVQDTLNGNYQRGGSLQGSMAWQGVEDKMLQAKTETDLIRVMAAAEKTFQRYGGTGHRDAFLQKAIVQFDKLEKVAVAINQIGEMSNGLRQVDPKVIDAHLGDYFTAHGIDPRQQPEAAGGIVARLGISPSGLKDDFSNMMASPNVASQQTALRYYTAINGYFNDPDAAKGYMKDEAKQIYDAAKSLSGGPIAPQNVGPILEQINQNRDALNKEKGIKWESLTGDTSESAAYSTIHTALTKSVLGTSLLGFTIHQGAFSGSGENVIIDPATEATLRDTLKTSAVLSGRRGVTDIQTIADETFQNAQKSGKLEILPVQGGQALVRLKSFGDTDSSGQPLVPLSPAVMNPATHQPESTIQTFHTDMGEAAKVLPGVFEPDKMSVSPTDVRDGFGKKPGGSDGVYWLERNGARLQIGLGQPLDVSAVTQTPTGDYHATPSKVTLSSDPAKAQKQLQAALPANRGLVLVPNDPTHPDFFYVGYRPHLTGVPTPQATPQQRQDNHTQEMIKQGAQENLGTSPAVLQ